MVGIALVGLAWAFLRTDALRQAKLALLHSKPSALPIEGVGTLYLGQVTATPGERRLAMIHLDLGKRGMVIVGLDDVNGEPMP